MLPAVLSATLLTSVALGQSNADRQQEIDIALDHYPTLKSASQISSVVDYLQHLDHTLVSEAIIDRILGSRTGSEATAYNHLIAEIGPEGCTAVINRLKTAQEAVEKGKLIVALRHCDAPEGVHLLIAALGDTRKVPFEAKTSTPRRVCDLAYDELFLKLRNDSRYGLDASAKMVGVIGEKTPVKKRDELIGKLKAVISSNPPAMPVVPSLPPPTPSPRPVTA